MGQKRKKINGKELVLDISYDIVGSVLYALGIYTFAKTADFAPGRITGLALIMNHLWMISDWYYNPCPEYSAYHFEL